VHGHPDNHETRQTIREFLEPAEAYVAEGREQESLPG
jgi:hypothetical protein